MKDEIVYGITDTGALDKRVLDVLINRTSCYDVFTFTGPLGAGKTTLIQQLLKACGVHNVIASPTFNYVHMYTNNKEQTFYHFDLYRIANIEEFLNLGFDEYLYQANSWAFIEWPQVIAPLLTHDVCHVTIDYFDGLSKRKMTLQAE